MVGRTSRRMQSDDAVHEGALVEDRRDRRIFIAERGDRQGALRGGGGESIAQGRVRIDKGTARQMQAHHLHQHLVGVGGPVKRARPRRMISGGFRIEQAFPRGLAFGMKLADFRFLLVRQTGRHRPGRDEHGRQMPEGLRGDDESRHDLIADA